MAPVPVPDALVDQPFTERDLPALRRTVAAHAARTAVPPRRVSDLVLVVSELAANSVRHGGGRGRVRVWRTRRAIHCEVSDEGPGMPRPYPLPDRRPEPTLTGGRGLWLVWHYADAVVIDSAPGHGTVITASLDLDGRPTPG